MTDFVLPDGSRISRDELLARAQQAASRDPIEDYANGWRTLTVRHGDLENDEQVQQVYQLRQGIEYALQGGYTVVAGNDYTSWRIPPRLVPAAASLVDMAHDLNPGWWRIEAPGLPGGREGHTR